jgi:helix-turn-helix protein
MGRPMRPVDPAEGPVQQFAAALRELREQAGSPTFRQLAKHTHYSATTLSVACSGRALPSLDVVLALVRACHGEQDVWRRRWRAAGGRTEDDARPSHLAPPVRTGPVLVRPELVRHLVPWAGWVAALAAITLLISGMSGGRQVAARPAGRPAAAWSAGMPPMYVGITRCDPGSYAVLSTTMTLPRPVRLGDQAFEAGSVVGTVYLMYSPRCAEGWPKFAPAGSFFNLPGTLTLRSRSTPDNSVSTSPRYRVIRFADGEPMLTVPGCVDAEATVEFGVGGPSVTAATPCFQRG